MLFWSSKILSFLRSLLGFVKYNPDRRNLGCDFSWGFMVTWNLEEFFCENTGWYLFHKEFHPIKRFHSLFFHSSNQAQLPKSRLRFFAVGILKSMHIIWLEGVIEKSKFYLVPCTVFQLTTRKWMGVFLKIRWSNYIF